MTPTKTVKVVKPSLTPAQASALIAAEKSLGTKVIRLNVSAKQAASRVAYIAKRKAWLAAHPKTTATVQSPKPDLTAAQKAEASARAKIIEAQKALADAQAQEAKTAAALSAAQVTVTINAK